MSSLVTWLTSPLLALDTETTGTDPETDRIVTLCLGRSDKPGHWQPHNALINPGAPIPAEATKIHGITDELASAGQSPADALPEVHAMLTQAAERKMPVVGHNLAFDLTLLDRELGRHLGLSLPGGLIVLDTLVLFWRFDMTTGSRSLSKIAEREGITFPAHDAAADALASLRLLHILAGRQDVLAYLSPLDLQHLQTDWYARKQFAAYVKRLGNGDEVEPPNYAWPLIPRKDTAS